jgi:protein-tyrosine kinase
MTNEPRTIQNDQNGEAEQSTALQHTAGALIRAPKEIVYVPETGKPFDQDVIDFQFYNSFNYSLLSNNGTNVRLCIGITSPNPAEGKTLIASNLAVSLSLGYQKKAVVVDLNVQQPRMRDIFGIASGPGLIDALQVGPIHVYRTSVENLSVVPAGPPRTKRSDGSKLVSQMMRIEHTAAFGDIIFSLQQEFDFVIVDMPSIHTKNFPILFANQLDGILVVLAAGKTRREDISKMFRHLNERQVLGFVFNRIKDEQL